MDSHGGTLILSNKKQIIPDSAIKRREFWINRISELDNEFSINAAQIETEIGRELKSDGISALLNHLRLCGNIPEKYGHDTSEEKLYSKYTDALLSYAYKELGLKSFVIHGRADVADVDVFGESFSFVADAKAFRLSRTAKNQKDFKVPAMNRWKHGKPYAMVVCPIYQLPSTQSQIYLQAINEDVCIFTYSHLSLLVRYANKFSKKNQLPCYLIS